MRNRKLARGGCLHSRPGGRRRSQRDQPVTDARRPLRATTAPRADVLWDTGVGWAQRRAARLFRQASQEGLIRRHAHACASSLELNLHGTTAGVALLSLHAWLAELL